MRRIGLVVAILGSALLLVVTPAGAGLQAPGWQYARSDLAGPQVALSCVTPSWCMSVGYGGNLTWDGQQWTKSPGKFQFHVFDVSCSSRWDCMAVGSDNVEVAQSEETVQIPVAMHWNGSDWNTLHVPVSLPDETGLFGVDCPAAKTCIVVGGLRDRTLLWQAGTWTSLPIPVPAGADTIGLSDVDCLAVTTCHAIGDVHLTGQPWYVTRSVVATWDGTSWSSELVSPDTRGDVPYLDSISCPTTTSCVAGGAVRQRAASEVWDGTTWQEIEAPASPHASDSGELNAGNYEAMTSVSCWAAGRCQAIGENFSTEVHWVLQGTTWRLLDNPSPNEDLADAGTGYAFLSDVDCYYAAFCLAVGDLDIGGLVDEALMERFAP